MAPRPRQHRRCLPHRRRLRRHRAKGLFARVLRVAELRRRLPECAEECDPQIQLLSLGLMGSGKSTLLRALVRVFGGVWLNQDEFCHTGRQAKEHFLAAIHSAATSRRDSAPLVAVDKINTLRSHRSEVVSALSGRQRRRRALLRFVHPSDPRDVFGSNAIELCLRRIAARGNGHRSLHADNPRLAQILRGTAESFEKPSAEELCGFDAVHDVDITCAPDEALRQVLAHLEQLGWLSNQHRKLDLQEALAGAVQLEAVLRSDACSQALTSSLQAAGAAPQESEPSMGAWTSAHLPAYWAICFEETIRSRELWEQLCRGMPKYFKHVGDKHITLLYAGLAPTDELAAKKSQLSVHEFLRCRLECERWSGREVEVTLTHYVQDADAACVAVSLPEGLVCASGHPHITLAHSPQVGPAHSNLLLKRSSASSKASGLVQRALGPPLPLLRGWVRPCWGTRRAAPARHRPRVRPRGRPVPGGTACWPARKGGKWSSGEGRKRLPKWRVPSTKARPSQRLRQ